MKTEAQHVPKSFSPCPLLSPVQIAFRTEHMHPLFEKASGLTEGIIAAAIEVHRDKGPGLIESIYEWCLTTELGLRSLESASQKTLTIEYKGFTREYPLRFDVLVEGCVLLDIPLGLLINFHEMQVINGVSRLVLPGAGQQ